MIWILLGILAVSFLYYKISEKQKTWTKRGVKQKEQVFFFGDSVDMYLKKKDPIGIMKEWCEMFSKERYEVAFSPCFKISLN